LARVEAAAIDDALRAPPAPLEQCDRAIIESALHAPAAQFSGVGEAYPSLESKAAVLVYSLAKSQACIDGNKRVALILLVEFLSLNGAELRVDNDSVADMILSAAESSASDRDRVIMELTTWFERSLAPCG
jgi:death-on-curing protein